MKHFSAARKSNVKVPAIIGGLAAAFWITYLIVQKSALSSDEIYHSHVIWLLRNGYEHYADFYSNHLPFYYEIVVALLPETQSELGFVWHLKALSLLVFAAYLVMLRPSVWPYLAIFCVFGRILEIRPDTFGLLLFNIAWWLLLSKRSGAVVPALIASLALLFSARAAVMMLPFAGLCLYLTWPRPSRLLLAGLAFVASVLAYATTDLEYFKLMVRSVYLDTLSYAGMVPLWERIFSPDRFFLMALIVLPLVKSINAFRKGDADALIGVVALVSQIFVILIDPAPYGYVYGWAVVPALWYLPGSDRQRMVAAGLLAISVVTANLIFTGIRGNPPQAASILRLHFQRPISFTELNRTEDTDLIPLLFKRQNLGSQIALREEICRRFQGRVISHFWYHPICMPDSFYRWQHTIWPVGQYPHRGREPSLVIWGAAADQPRLLEQFEVHDGYAVSRHRPRR